MDMPDTLSEPLICLIHLNYNNPILIFYGIFSAYMPYSAFGCLSVSVCVRLRQKKQNRISIC